MLKQNKFSEGCSG